MKQFKEKFLKSSMLAMRVGIEPLNNTKIIFEVQDEDASKTCMEGSVVGLTCAILEIINALAKSTGADSKEVLEVLSELNEM